MKFPGTLKTVVAAVGVLLLLGFGIGSNASMPGYAPIYLDDAAKTYIALPCLGEWQNRHSETHTLLRLSRATEARALKYGPDENCRETGAFLPADRSLTGLLLVKLGILPPIRFWWDAPYRTEAGVVVDPRQ